MNSIPASQLVQVIPGVLGAGGNPLALNAVFLSQDDSIPTGAVLPFSTLEDVKAFFGSDSPEAVFATVYFNGYDGARTLPETLYFFRYFAADVAAFLRGGSVEGMTLTELQALSGVVTIVIDGRTVTSASVNLSSATSFSNAAALLQTGLRTTGGIFVGTANQTASSDVVTVTAVSSGALHVGDIITGTGVDSGLEIVSFGSGTGGTGTYHVSTTTGFSSTTIDVTSAASVSYDSQLHAFVITSSRTGATDSSIAFPTTDSLTTGLKLTSATGAILSAGADALTPSSAMDQVTSITQNWATFMTVWEPDTATKVLFADWVNGTVDRYAYVAWDSDVTALEPDATASFGVLTESFDGVVAIWNPDGKVAAFICGTAASIDFNVTNGRITFAFKSQPGMTVDVTNATIADNLTANGYNFYASYATANQQFQFYQTGKISGRWLWLDAYVNQIFFNSQLQLAGMSLLATTPSIPYNNAGITLYRQALQDPINQALNFGTIRTGVPLSNAQAAQVNSAAGLRISDTLQQVGYYLQVQNATPQVRAERGPFPSTLWYMDGGSVQRLRLASIDVL